MVQLVKSPPANAGDARHMGLIPELGRFPEEGNGNLLQNFCLGNPMDRGSCQATVQRSLVDYSSWDHKELDMTECARAHTHTHTHTHIYIVLSRPAGQNER